MTHRLSFPSPRLSAIQHQNIIIRKYPHHHLLPPYQEDRGSPSITTPRRPIYTSGSPPTHSQHRSQQRLEAARTTKHSFYMFYFTIINIPLSHLHSNETLGVTHNTRLSLKMLQIYLSIYLYLSISIYLSVYLSVYLFVYSVIYLVSIYLSIYLSLYL